MTVRPFLALCATLFLAAGCASGAQYRAIERETASQAGGLVGSMASTDFLDVGINFAARAPSALATMDPAAFAASRLVARDATLSIELPVEKDADGKVDKKATSKSIEQAAKSAAETCKKLKGWVVYESQQRVVLRIPSESLDLALKEISALGEVTGQSINGTDVTDEHRDNAIRLDNLEKSRQRYITLLEAAEDVKAALAVEKELQRVTLEIERLKGKQKSIETSVRFSLVSVSFSAAYAKKAKPTPGPLGWIFYGLWWFVKWLFIWD
jgi:hypothetical protein